MKLVGKKCVKRGHQGELRSTEDDYDQDILYTGLKFSKIHKSYFKMTSG